MGNGGYEMKLMIASDIHGSAFWCRKLLAVMEEEKPDKMVLLGDLLYHGPRNALPDEYAPQVVAAMLNRVKNRLICVRGNCEAEVDQMMLEFPVLGECALIYAGKRTIYATHGHQMFLNEIPNLLPGEVLLYGHTHVPQCEKKNGLWYVNPGSVSIPKGGSCHSCLIMEGDELTWKNLENGAVRREMLTD